MNESLSSLLSRIAQETPNATAISHSDTTLSYMQFYQRVELMAASMLTAAQRSPKVIAVHLDRSIDLAAAAMACMRLGAAFMPIDTQYPLDRIEAILVQDGIDLLLTSKTRLNGLPGGSGVQLLCTENINYDFSEKSLKTACTRLNELSVAPEDTAYVIHTSGSTGVPKGVALPHRALTNILAWQAQHHPYLAAPLKTLQFASIGFDVASQEILSSVHSGGELVITDSNTAKNPTALLRFIANQKIERLFMPFPVLQALATEYQYNQQLDFSSLKLVITAGEALVITKELSAWLDTADCRLINQYGPCETHVATAYTSPLPLSQWPKYPPIGIPSKNNIVQILNERLQPVDKGEIGEIFIAGAGLATAYFNRPDLTLERFLPSSISTHKWMYKSGDLGCYLEDGNMQFCGRADRQVKIDGFRIEPGEVEAMLNAIDDVANAVVLPKQSTTDDARKFLVGYIVVDQAKASVVGKLEYDVLVRRYKETLAGALPHYMVPSQYYFVDEIPLTNNGKVARDLLLALDSSNFNNHQQADSEDPIETTVLAIYRQLLDREQMLSGADFFENGGTSLLAMRLIREIKTQFNVEVGIKQLMQNSKVADLSAYITSALTPA